MTNLLRAALGVAWIVYWLSLVGPALAACDYDVGGSPPLTMTRLETQLDEELGCIDTRFDGIDTSIVAIEATLESLGAGSATLADGDYGDITVSSAGGAMNIDAGVVGQTEIATDGVGSAEIAADAVGASEIAADSVAMTTDTTGNYVASVADGTGIDGTASAEGATYTPTLDLTEINSFTLGAGSATGITFDAGAVDPVIGSASGELTISAGGTAPVFSLDDQASFRFYEEDANGVNYIQFQPPAAITSNITCTLQNDSTPLDLCVTGGGGSGIAAVVQDTAPQLGGQLDVNSFAIGDGTRELITFVEDGSAVNQIEVENNATGQPAILRATGDDTNVDLRLEAKGSGALTFEGTAIALSTNILGKKTIGLPAGSLKARATNGPDCSGVSGAASVEVPTCAFDAGTDETAMVALAMPKGADETAGLDFQFIWTSAAGSGNVVWGVACGAVGDDDPLNVTMGTAQTVTDAVTLAADQMTSSATSTLTPGGTWAEEDMIYCQIYRDADNGSDTMSGDALLLAVRARYTVNAAIDN